jgi:rhodanese-related sulfurtransferase/DNA-binding transcriptional ArsR family regulator
LIECLINGLKDQKMDESGVRWKSLLYEQLARVGKAVSSPQRLELLDLLCQGPRSVESLARESSLSVANASRHLQVLREARLVEGRKDGKYVMYRLSDPAVCGFYLSLRGLAEDRLAELRDLTRRYVGDKEGMEPIAKEALLERVRGGEVTVLDVRPVEEYEAGHIAGALSIPIQELEARLSELADEREIVAYCRGPYCVYAKEAVELLVERGFQATRLSLGVPDWRMRGFEVETGVPS